MAVVRNITPDARSLFSADAPPAEPGDDVTISDARFVDRAWPKSTWELVEPPALEGYTDQSVEDAYLWAPEPVIEETPEPALEPEPTAPKRGKS